MEIRLDYANMMADVIGPAQGIREEALHALRPTVRRIHADLMQRRAQGALPFYDLPFQQRELDEIQATADQAAGRFREVVVLGIGGSALGTTAIFRALAHLHHNLLPPAARQGRPRLFVLDNVDPCGLSQLFGMLDPAATLLLVISKSGSTVETMAQFLVARRWVEEAVGERYREHFLLVTDPEAGGLRKLAREQGYAAFSIPARVGGRFSVFTPVGLLPLAMAGIDVRRVLAGAAAMEPRVTAPELMENPAYLSAALQYLAYGQGQRISVFMPYSDRLRDLADWFRQLWAESLGKRLDLDGKIVEVGPTPVDALGTTDQHSQVQLYMEGPRDKVVTFLIPDDFGESLPLPSYVHTPGLDYLAGRTMAELMRSEQQATAMALARNGRPNCTLRLPAVTPEAVGALIYLLEVQTVFAGGLFHVDPLDQPGVEEGKELTYGLMGRAGFEARRAEFDRWQAASGHYTL